MPTLSQTIGQLNLYAYANNNPIAYTDETGESFILAAIIIGAIVGAIIGATASGVSAANNGATGWELAGAIAEGALIGGLIGGAIGAVAGFAAGPTAGAFLSSSFAFGSGAAAVSVTGAQLATGAVIATGVGIVFSKIPMHGDPNSFVQNGDSFGEYDENGNLKYRTDTGHSHFIKELQDYFQPHTHHFTWRKVNGIWRFFKTVLPR